MYSHYGEPTLYRAVQTVIGMDGLIEVEIDVKDVEKMRRAMERCALLGEISWDNIRILFTSRDVRIHFRLPNNIEKDYDKINLPF